MASGKRSSKEQPLTEHDVAERVSGYMFRCLNALLSVRQLEQGQLITSSRYWHPELVDDLIKELEEWKKEKNP